MKVRVFTMLDSKEGRPDMLNVDEPHVRVRIEHGPAEFDISIDGRGRLLVHDVDGRQIIVVPSASNQIELRAEAWKP